MKKKLFLVTLMVAILMCLLVISVNAGTFGEADTTANIPVGSVITDTTSQIQMSDGKIYPAYYFFDDSTTGKFNFSKVTKADGSAYTKGDIVKVEIPEGVVQLEDYNFTEGKCTLLEFVTLPSTLKTITRQAFNGTPKLTSITVPDNVEVIGNAAFRSCKALTEIIINPTSSLKEIDACAFQNTALQSFYFPNTLEVLGNHVFAYNENNSLTTLVNFENCAVTSIPQGLFRQCGGLKTVKFPKGITEINGKEMFTYCNVDVIYLPMTLKTISNKIEASSIGKVIFAAPEGTELPANAPVSATLEYANYCEVYYKGVHKPSENYELDFADFASPFNEVSICTACGIESKVNEKDYAPIFVFAGYSDKENGTALCAGYTVNHTSMAVYKEYNPDVKLEYGIFAAAYGTELIIGENGVEATSTNAIVADVNTDYAGYDFILRGFDNEGGNTNTALVICSYISDGSSIVYVTKACSDTVPEAITMAKVKSLG